MGGALEDTAGVALLYIYYIYLLYTRELRPPFGRAASPLLKAEVTLSFAALLIS
jgi:hypothetical protein